MYEVRGYQQCYRPLLTNEHHCTWTQVIEARVKVMWNCSIVVICIWFISILCPLLSLLCHTTNHINTGPLANHFIHSLFCQVLSVLQHFFKRYKINYTQKPYSKCLLKQSILITRNTIIVILLITLINFALNEKLKGVVITLHHKFHLLWEWLLSWKRLSWDTEVEGKGNCPYSMSEWDEWSPEEPFKAKRDTTSVNSSSYNVLERTNEWFFKNIMAH